MGLYIAGHSLGLTAALAIAGYAVPRGGYVVAFWLLAVGAVIGGAVAIFATRSTANVVTLRSGAPVLGTAVLKNKPAMLITAGYTMHSWELLGMWAWTPAFLAACFVAAGSDLTRSAGLGALMTALFHVTGTVASVTAGLLADRYGDVVPPAYRGSALAIRSLLGYGAGAAAPLVFGAILDWFGARTPAAWGWAFLSLGVAGVGAVTAVVWLHRTPEAGVLRRTVT
jgi:hypothetical protein